MKGSVKIAEVFGITINVHMTFLLLCIPLALFSIKTLFLVIGLFFFVTIHELSHSLVARYFGVAVKEITLLPIGGVASMTKMPEKPYQEFFISIAGPLTNVAVVVLLYFPVRLIVGPEMFFGVLRSFFSGYIPIYNAAFIVTQIYWMNLFLAAFNLLPAFPMDGGRILRSLLADRLGMQRATKIAVNFGHAFALLFAFWGFQHNFLLVLIAIFIFMGASSEELQVDIKETLKKFRVKDILSAQFDTVRADTAFSGVLELILKSRQEDFPVMDNDNATLIGFITRGDVIQGVHQFGVQGLVSSVMRKDIRPVTEAVSLDKVQALMQGGEIKALPVVRDGAIVGVVTTDDIHRVYSMMAARR